jgi:hypothetical protein
MSGQARRIAYWSAVAAVLLLATSCAAGGSSTAATAPSTEASPSPSPIESVTPSPEPTPIPSAAPSPVPSPSPSLPVQILFGMQYGSIRALTLAGATCNARAILPDGTDAPGLRNPQVADQRGIVNWSYVQYPTDEGKGFHVVACSLNGLDGTALMAFSITN